MKIEFYCAPCDQTLRGVWADEPRECPRCRSGDDVCQRPAPAYPLSSQQGNCK